VKHLEGKRVTQVGLGDDFIVALGLTLPSVELNRLAKSTGVLRLKPEEEQEGEEPKRAAPQIKRLTKKGGGPPSAKSRLSCKSDSKSNYS
jgi:hypothetical protein